MEQIPFIDIRHGNPSEIAREHRQRGITLIGASKNAFGLASRLAAGAALPLGDSIARRWLSKTNNPYRHEIDATAAVLGIKGVHALNLCYEWGCTSGAYEKNGGVTLTRILDWPFPALGECMVVAHQKGEAGEFYNMTWPGMAGVFNAVAPGRFAAALNQAPMRRYRLDIVSDWMRNRLRVRRAHALPPAHLLRKAFEEAGSYDEAKEMLSREPVAIPVIYILSGTQPGQGCVIERLEDAAEVRLMRDGKISAANHFESRLNGIGHGWLPRAIDSHDRAHCGRELCGPLLDDDFGWFRPPIANRLSRLVLSADAATGSFNLMGTEGQRPVTPVYRHPGRQPL